MIYGEDLKYLATWDRPDGYNGKRVIIYQFLGLESKEVYNFSGNPGKYMGASVPLNSIKLA